MRLSTLQLALSLLLVTLIGCGENTAPAASEPKQARYIVATNSALAYFATRLLDGEIDVQQPAPPDTDPAQWTPDVSGALTLQGAQLVLLNGAGYEGWLDKVALADNRLANTSAGFRQQWIELAGEVTHSHGPKGAHAHSGYAFTTWMDMSLARQQAQMVASALSAHFPDKARGIADRLPDLVADIDELDAQYRALTEPLRGRQVIYSHPVYQYFERAYDLAGTSLHWEPGVMPGEAQWQALDRLAEANALFVWEGESDKSIADKMASRGVAQVIIDPASNTVSPDWLAVQRNNVARLQEVTGTTGGQ